MKGYDFIVTNAPVNKTAATVLSKGDHWDPDTSKMPIGSDTPLETRPFHGRKKDDMYGKKSGRLVVVGHYVKKSAQDKALWVVRCVCGRYETRSKRALLNGKNKDDCCAICRKVEWMRRNPQGGTVK